MCGSRGVEVGNTLVTLAPSAVLFLIELVPLLTNYDIINPNQTQPYHSTNGVKTDMSSVVFLLVAHVIVIIAALATHSLASQLSPLCVGVLQTRRHKWSRENGTAGWHAHTHTRAHTHSHTHTHCSQ